MKGIVLGVLEGIGVRESGVVAVGEGVVGEPSWAINVLDGGHV